MTVLTQTFDENARGVYIITVTPFTETGALDLESTDRMVDFYLEQGVDGLTVLGILGEAPKLTAQESAHFVERVIARVNGQIPVVVGASAAGFASMGELTRRVMDMGAAGVMVAPAHHVRTDDQIRSYFAMVNETLGPDVPWVLQDHPNSTGVQMSSAVVMQVIAQSPRCDMLKHEDSPGFQRSGRLKPNRPCAKFLF